LAVVLLAAPALAAAPAAAQLPLGAQLLSPVAVFGGPADPADPGLLIPVEGVEPDELRDTFHADRSGGREHAAIDIHAPRGTPVVAAADGTILRLHSGARGGIAVYQLGADGRTRYYYAHLDRYAEGLELGDRVRRGEVIGYVGDTGNAAPGDFHLHFSVVVLEDARRWWEGAALNPYPLLRASARRAFGIAPRSPAARSGLP
ncbi:MAG TPA: M23 family metallopeptidase, partial [Longimicrobiaceae bacterium]|nr:M23 family metallopeptidase [Longimicrobiaceae bacterium]